MAYATINKPTDYFNTVLYTGNATNPKAVTGVGFQPDLVWIKDRDFTYNHQVHDVVRGADQALITNATTAEADYNSFVSFDSDGFSVTDANGTNKSGNNHVAWNWLAGGTASSNTDGTTTTQVSANTTSGFSIATYTGNGSNGATVGHGLGATPDVVILRRRNGTEAWPVWTSSLAGNTSYLRLNGTDVVSTATDLFNSTTPNSSVVTLGTGGFSNTNTWTYVMYCFKSIEGFSKFGSYTGNGSTDGPFIYTGFKPAFVMTKRTDVANDWNIQDTKRQLYNGQDAVSLQANTTSTESTIGAGYEVDFLSNGFKRRNGGTETNGSGGSYTYMAFAESPLVGTNNIPATAR